jgi:hypothetical protein
VTEVEINQHVVEVNAAYIRGNLDALNAVMSTLGARLETASSSSNQQKACIDGLRFATDLVRRMRKEATVKAQADYKKGRKKLLTQRRKEERGAKKSA